MPNPPAPSERYLSPAEVAEMLGLTTRSVYTHVAEGRLPASRLSRKMLRIAESDVHAFVAARRIGATA